MGFDYGGQRHSVGFRWLHDGSLCHGNVVVVKRADGLHGPRCYDWGSVDWCWDDGQLFWRSVDGNRQLGGSVDWSWEARSRNGGESKCVASGYRFYGQDLKKENAH